MTYDARGAIAAYATNLLSTGQVIFRPRDVEHALGIGHGAFLDAAERLQRKRLIVSPRQGFYIVVPPQYLAWGAPPPSWYIDALMRHEGHPYYVGLLKAAELHGATHHAVQEFQVITNARIPTLHVGRSAVAFYFRRNMASVASGMMDHKTDTGTMKISSVELTALDLVRYPRAGGGLDLIATTLADLAPQVDPKRLGRMAPAFERSVVQRLGYLLSHAGFADRAEPLFARLARGPAVPWVELDASDRGAESDAPPPIEHDLRWRVVARRVVEAPLPRQRRTTRRAAGSARSQPTRASSGCACSTTGYPIQR